MKIKNILSIGLLSLGLANNAMADDWVYCNSCSESQKIAKAKQFNGTMINMVHITDKNNDSVDTYEVQSYYEEGRGRRGFNFTTIAKKVASLPIVIQAAKESYQFLHENNNWRFDAHDLGSPYRTAAYLINSRNASDVASLINDRINDSYTVSSWTETHEGTKGSFMSAVSQIDVFVEFEDLSTAKFALDHISTTLGQNGQVSGRIFNFKLIELKDKDGHTLPLDKDSMRGAYIFISNAAAGTWQTVFNMLGMEWSTGSRIGTGMSIDCTANAECSIIITQD